MLTNYLQLGSVPADNTASKRKPQRTGASR